jgi:hypothetical protein
VAEATQIPPEPAASLVPIGLLHEQTLSLIALRSYRGAPPAPG